MAGQKLSLSSRFTLTMVSVAILAITTVGGVAWFEARDSLIDASFDNLSSVERSKAREIENYVGMVSDQLIQLSGDLTVVEAAVRLNRGFDALALEPVPEDMSASIESYYEDQFLPQLDANSTGTPDFAIFKPVRQTALQVQYHYMTDNANALGVKHFLDDAGDGSEYSQWHAHYHPGFRSLLEHSNYYDLFIIDIEEGDIVYSVFKEADVGTNLLDGPYRNSGLAEVVRGVMSDPIRESVKIVDFKPYAPSYNAPAAFVAAPIYNADNPVGILALQVPIDEINAVMTSQGNWYTEGLGESGEAYLVGNDRLMRSDSRFLIEDKPSFLDATRASGVQGAIVDTMDRLNSTIILQRIDSPAVSDAIAGERGTQITTSYRGVEVLSSYSPLDIAGLDWVLLAEIDRSEVLAPVNRLLRRILIAAALFVSIIALASARLGRRFNRPVRDAANVAGRVIEDRGLDVESFESREHGDGPSFDERAAGDVGVLGQRLNILLSDADSQRTNADQRYDDFVSRVTKAMPWSAGERFRRGEHDTVDVGTRCFAIAIQVLSGSGTAPAESSAGDHSDTEVHPISAGDEVHKTIDDCARSHGIDLFSHVGFEYVGIVGLTATYLDSIDRAVSFAEDVLGFASTSRTVAAAGLRVRIAIDVSAMRGVMTAESPYGYRVWGDAILRAQAVAHQTDPGELRITNEVHRQIADHRDIAARNEIVDLGGETVTCWTIEPPARVASSSGARS